jgi:hypothetical protein
VFGSMFFLHLWQNFDLSVALGTRKELRLKNRLQFSCMPVSLDYLSVTSGNNSNSLMTQYPSMLPSFFTSVDSRINRYFKNILFTVSSTPFYTTHISLPSLDDPIPDFIQNNPKFNPFFSGALGAMDGTHINCCPSAADRHAARNRKGGVLQNCLACCSFAFRFLYVIGGWEGSAADATLYANARLTDFLIPDGKYYLADATASRKPCGWSHISHNLDLARPLDGPKSGNNTVIKISYSRRIVFPNGPLD